MDLESFAASLGLEEGEYLELVELFIEATSSDLKFLADAAIERDPGKVAELAHSIKGASINLGFTEFSSLAKQIEVKARGNLLAGVAETASALSSQLESLKQSVEKRLRP